MSAGRRIAGNVGALAVSKVATLGLSFAVWVHLARTLTPDGVGVLTYGTALLAYFVLVVALGFDAVTVREIARDRDRARDLVPTVLGLRLVLLGGAAAVYAVLVWVLPQTPAERTVLLVLGGLLVVRAVQLDWVYQGLEEMGTIAIRDVAASAIAAGGAFAFVRGPDDVLPAAAAIVAGPLLSNASLLVAYGRRYGLAWPRFDRAAWLAVLLPALPLVASAFVSEIYYSLDKIMLEGLRTTSEVGLYGVAYKVFALSIAPTGVLYGAFFPAIAATLGSPERMRSVSEVYARLQFGIGCAVTAAGVVFADVLVVAVFGAEYAEAGGALRLLFLNAGVIYANMVFGVPLMAWDRQGAYFRAVAAGGVANVALNVALIRPFGIEGAALATLLSEAVVLVGLATLYRGMAGRVFAGVAARAVGVALVGAALPAAVLVNFGVSVFVAAPVVAVVSLGALWASGLVALPALRSLLHSSP